MDVPEEHKDILNYQFASAQYSRDIIRFFRKPYNHLPVSAVMI